MSSILFIKFAILMVIALISVYAGSAIGEGPLPILLVMGAGLMTLLYVRNADRLALRSDAIGVHGVYSMALGDVRRVRHTRDIDVLQTQSGYTAIAALEVVDLWSSYEVLTQRQVAVLVTRHGELLGSVGGVEVQLEVVGREGSEPVFRFHVMARSRREAEAVARAEAVIKELHSNLSSLGIVPERVRCSGSPESCGLTRLVNVEARGAPTSKTPGTLQAALSMLSLALAYVLSPGVAPLVASLSVPALFSGIFITTMATRMARRGYVAPLRGSDMRLVEGRILVGSTHSSFGALRYIEHYDRVLNEEDIARLVEGLNDLLYNGGSYQMRLSFRRADEAMYRRKESLRMDMSHLDYETGGGISKRLKAHKHEIRLERMRALGEKPFEVYGVFIVKTSEGREAAKVRESAFKSRLSALGFKLSWVRNPVGIARCVRMLYMGPSEDFPLIEPASVENVKALTLDFSWISPFAIDRSPLLVREGIFLGYDRRGRPVYWNPMALRNAHMGIFGPPGSGKSTLVKTLILRAARFYRERHGYSPTFVIIDPASEYRKIAESLGGVVVNMTDRKVNPLLLSGASPHERANKVTEMFRYVLALKGEERAELKDVILEAYKRAGIDENNPATWRIGIDRDVTMRTVYEIVRERLAAAEETRDPMLPTLKSLVDKLRDICEGARALDRTGVTVVELIENHVLIENGPRLLCLSFKDQYGAIGLDMQRIIVWTLLEQLKDYLVSMEVEEQLRVMVIIDEGYQFIQLGTIVEGGIQVTIEPPTSHHLRATRKFGASYVFVTHLPKDTPPGVTSLMGTAIALSATDTDYLNWAEDEFRLTPQQVSALERAGIGRGFMRWLDDPRPLFVRFVPEEAAMVRDAIATRMQALRGSPAGLVYTVSQVQRIDSGPRQPSPPGEDAEPLPEERDEGYGLRPRPPAGPVKPASIGGRFDASRDFGPPTTSSGAGRVARGHGGAMDERRCPRCGKVGPGWARRCSHCNEPFGNGGGP